MIIFLKKQATLFRSLFFFLALSQAVVRSSVSESSFPVVQHGCDAHYKRIRLRLYIDNRSKNGEMYSDSTPMFCCLHGSGLAVLSAEANEMCM